MSEADSNITTSAQKHKRGDVREDGMVFACYQQDGRQRWIKPEDLEKIKERARLRARSQYYANPETAKKKNRVKYQKNRDSALRKAKVYYQTKKEQILTKNKLKYTQNKNSILAKNKKWKKDNRFRLKQKDQEYKKKKYQSDPVFCLKIRLRARIANAIRKNGWSKKSKTQSIIGCSWEELKAYLESRFLEKMNWSNRGMWHIDHIIPLANATTLDEMEKLCHYTNLQPLWGLDNLKKGSRINH